MGDATKTRMGACNVTFNGSDLGYTKGFVKVSYSAESMEKTVDQEDAPVDEIITKQNFEVTVPLAEYDLTRLADIFPGATLVTDSVDPTKKKLVLSGASGGSLLLDIAAEMVLSPVGSTDPNDNLTIHHAAPVPNVSYTYDKDNLRVYEVTFRALVGNNGWVTFGDTTASGA